MPGLEAVVTEGRALSCPLSPLLASFPSGFLSLLPSFWFSLWVSQLEPSALSLHPPPTHTAVTVTSELKYSWKHRPCLVNFMSRFSAQMT